VVSSRRQGLLRGTPELQRLLQVGRRDAEVPGEPRGDAHVLRHERQLEAGGEGAGQHLLGDLAFRGAVTSGGSIDGLEHRPGIQAEGLRDAQRLEPGERSRGAQVVVQRLHRVARPERPDVEDVATHRLEDRAHLLEGFASAAHHDGERGVLRFGYRAGDRCIDQVDAPRLQGAGERPCRGWIR
jgi:hypothetical protein